MQASARHYCFRFLFSLKTLLLALYREFLLFTRTCAQPPLDHPILVYTMGKVGTHTVRNALRAYDAGSTSLTAHHIDDSLVALDDHRHPLYSQQRHLLGATPRERNGFLARLWTKRLKVISLVRDPIARDIAWFFEKSPSCNPATRARSLAQLRQQFLADVTGSRRILNTDTASHLHWFDNEIKRTFSIDIFSVPFRKDRGYHIYEGPTADLLVLIHQHVLALP